MPVSNAPTEHTYKIFFITPYDQSNRLEEIVIGSYRQAQTLSKKKLELITLKNIRDTEIAGQFVHGAPDADLVVCNISKYNPNVLFELGMAHGADKAILLLIDNETPLNFDLIGFRYISYDLNFSKDLLVENISNAIISAIKTPADWQKNFSSV